MYEANSPAKGRKIPAPFSGVDAPTLKKEALHGSGPEDRPHFTAAG